MFGRLPPNGKVGHREREIEGQRPVVETSTLLIGTRSCEGNICPWQLLILPKLDDDSLVQSPRGYAWDHPEDFPHAFRGYQWSSLVLFVLNKVPGKNRSSKDKHEDNKQKQPWKITAIGSQRPPSTPQVGLAGRSSLPQVMIRWFLMWPKLEKWMWRFRCGFPAATWEIPNLTGTADVQLPLATRRWSCMVFFMVWSVWSALL